MVAKKTPKSAEIRQKSYPMPAAKAIFG